MKIALILTGHMRMFYQGYESFYQNILSKNDCDVFISTWSDTGFYTGKGYLQPRPDGFINLTEDDLGFHPSGEINYDEIKKLYHPLRFEVEDFSILHPCFKLRSQPFVNAYTRPKNTMSQFYKIHRGVSLWASYLEMNGVHYDWVYRARPDFVFQSPFNESFSPNIFYTNPGTNSRGVGLGDQFHCSNPENMFKFAQAYFYLEHLYNSLGYSCPHAFVQSWLMKMNITYDILKTPSTIAHSPHGIYKEPDTGEIYQSEK